jgi:hypothetical protein
MAINNISPKKGKVVDIPDATITIGTPTPNAGQVSVAFTVATTPATGGPVQGYTAISNPGNITANASASPVVVTGLTNGTAYTFQVAARNATGRGPLSAASASATPTDPAAFQSIATVTVGAGGQSTISFTSIPSTYKHLQLRCFARTTGAFSDDAGLITFNSDSNANYASHNVRTNGGITAAGGSANLNYGVLQRFSGANTTSGVFGVVIIDIADYTNTNKYKTFKDLGGHDNNGNGNAYLSSSLWMNTAAITSMTIAAPSQGGVWAQYSQFALYGIKG